MGWNEGTILRCYSQSLVKGISVVGGLVGYIGFGAVEECYSAGKVSRMRSHWENLSCEDWRSIDKCDSAGKLSGSSIGGLVGKNREGKVLNSYWDIDISPCTESDGGMGRNTTQMKQKHTYSGWDFTKVWKIYEGESYPLLRAFD